MFITWTKEIMIPLLTFSSIGSSRWWLYLVILSYRVWYISHHLTWWYHIILNPNFPLHLFLLYKFSWFLIMTYPRCNHILLPNIWWFHFCMEINYINYTFIFFLCNIFLGQKHPSLNFQYSIVPYSILLIYAWLYAILLYYHLLLSLYFIHPALLSNIEYRIPLLTPYPFPLPHIVYFILFLFFMYPFIKLVHSFVY